MNDRSKIVFIGDSITFGYGVHKERRWTNLLDLKFKIEKINKGVNGDTTAGILSRSFEDIIKIYPKYAVILAGTNDLLMGRSLSSIEDNITLLIEELREYKVTPILAAPIPICSSMAEIFWTEDVDYKKVNKEIYNYRSWMITYCHDNKIDVIDFFSIFQDAAENNKSSLIYIDGIHPTQYGHELMAHCAEIKLKYIIK
ncbi:MAG: hydrolase [Clostridiaceae bacterium]|jgi:lysophospholipase L1-like esterase|nr:hydrolase [Clostridiaceae bacterium]